VEGDVAKGTFAQLVGDVDHGLWGLNGEDVVQLGPHLGHWPHSHPQTQPKVHQQLQCPVWSPQHKMFYLLLTVPSHS
jgi:hypothetical protein